MYRLYDATVFYSLLAKINIVTENVFINRFSRLMFFIILYICAVRDRIQVKHLRVLDMCICIYRGCHFCAKKKKIKKIFKMKKINKDSLKYTSSLLTASLQISRIFYNNAVSYICLYLLYFSVQTWQP